MGTESEFKPLLRHLRQTAVPRRQKQITFPSLCLTVSVIWPLLFADEHSEEYCEQTRSLTLKRHKTHRSSCTVHTCTYTHCKPTHPAARPHTHSHALYLLLSHTLYHFIEEALQYEHVNVLAVVPVTGGESCSVESQ